MDIKDLEIGNKDLVLITGCGRSGTKSCAEYLNGYHEPRGSDWDFELDMFNQTPRGKKYVQRIKKHFLGMDRPYIEVNSAIAGVVKDLKRELPKLKVFHLVRNKEDVINSILKRENYTDESEPRNSPEPKGGFPEHFTRKDKVEWMVDQYYKFMEGFPVIEAESIPVKVNKS